MNIDKVGSLLQEFVSWDCELDHAETGEGMDVSSALNYLSIIQDILAHLQNLRDRLALVAAANALIAEVLRQHEELLNK